MSRLRDASLVVIGAALALVAIVMLVGGVAYGLEIVEEYGFFALVLAFLYMMVAITFLATGVKTVERGVDGWLNYYQSRTLPKH